MRSLAVLLPLPLLVPLVAPAPTGTSFPVVADPAFPGPATRSDLRVEPIDAPPDHGARYPRWSRAGDERLLLTFTTPVQAQASAADPAPIHAVRVAALGDDGFADAIELERGEGHFVNWADAPLVTAFPDGALFGAWLSANGSGPYAYGVRTLLQDEEPREQAWLHSDASATEHGFLSLTPGAGAARDGVDAVWLDGRAMAGSEDAGHGGHDAHGHGGGGAMALYTRRVSPGGSLGPELSLDARVCDCCQTSAARLTDGSLVVVYRDRGDKERRDISFVKLTPDGTAATPPEPVHVDGWIVPGCPVNGPEAVARGDRVAVAWYSEAGGTKSVLLALSDAGAAGFGRAVRVDEADETLGRASIAWLADGTILVAYLALTDPEEARGEWRVRRFRETKAVGDPVVIAEVEATRKSGFLRLVAHGSGAVAAWTDVETGYELRAARIELGDE